jgi:hypothetical protein
MGESYWQFSNHPYKFDPREDGDILQALNIGILVKLYYRIRPAFDKTIIIESNMRQ